MNELLTGSPSILSQDECLATSNELAHCLILNTLSVLSVYTWVMCYTLDMDHDPISSFRVRGAAGSGNALFITFKL